MFRTFLRALKALARITIILIKTPFGIVRRLVSAPPDPIQVAEERAVDRELDAVDEQAELLARQLAEEEERLERERHLGALRKEILTKGTPMEPDEEWVPDEGTVLAFREWATGIPIPA